MAFSITEALKNNGGVRSNNPPCLSRSGVPNGAAANPQFGSNLLVRTRINAHRSNIVLGQLRAGVLFPSPRASKHKGSTAFRRMSAVPLDHIIGVVLVASPSQMRRVHTCAIVARMQRQAPFRSGLTLDRQGDVSCQARRSNPPVEIDNSVSAGINCGAPKPTIGISALFHFSPKPGLHLNSQRWQGNVSHGAVLSHCGQGRALLKQRFRPAFSSRFMFRSQGLVA